MRITSYLLLAGFLSTGACLVIDNDGLHEQEEWDDEESIVIAAREHIEEAPMTPPDLREHEVDAVSAASEPPVLFVEIISPAEGATLGAGFSVDAFGGPGWAIPELELHVDGAQVDGIAGFNVSFETDAAMSEGSHTINVEFTCVLESCMGQTASASVNVNVMPGNSDPGDPDDPDAPRDPNDPTGPDEPTDSPDDPNQVGEGGFTGGSGCAVGGSNDANASWLIILALLALRRRRDSHFARDAH